jgi:putative SOS response-associated peptidase YedK
MCTDFEQHVAWKACREMMQLLEWGVPARQSEADLPRADDIRITDLAPVMKTAGSDIELAPMSFGFPPASPRAGPVFNFRSEGRSFASSNQCLIPASAFFEFTGSKSPRTKHRFTLNDAPFMAVAGIWREQQGNQPPAFTMLTTAPGPNVEPTIARSSCCARRYLTKSEAELLRPLPAGSLSVEAVRVGKG